MITELAESKGAVLGFKISGKVSSDEEKKWTGELDKVLKIHQKISVLLILDEKAGWGVRAGLEDLKWLVTHMKRLDKVAIVSDSTVWKWLIAVDRQFAQLVNVGEKHFKKSEISDAWDWVRS